MNDVPIRLRDATLADADLLDAWSRSPEAKGEFNDFGPPPDDAPPVRETLAKGPLRNDQNGQLNVERVADGQPIGTVGWHEVHYGPPPKSRAWNIGISLIPEARGQGDGGIAQRPLADYLFEQTDANRVEAQTDVDNVAEQRALENRAGAYHDLITIRQASERTLETSHSVVATRRSMPRPGRRAATRPRHP